MKKVFLKSLLLLCALIVGTNAWAVETPVVTADFTAKTANHSSYGDTWTYGDWSLTKCANNNGGWAYIRCGGKGGDKATSTTTSTTIIQGTSKINYDIKEVKVLHNGTSNNNFTVNSVVLEISTKSDFSSLSNEIELTPSISKEVSGTVSFTTGAPYASGSYYRVKINWTVKGKSNYGLDVTKVEFYEAEASTDPTISADDVELGCDDTSGEITYSISNAPAANTEVTASSDDVWISNITVDENTTKVSFTTTANTALVDRVGTITLTYRNTDTDEDLDDIDVTITQAKKVVTLYYTLATTVVPGRHYIITNGKTSTIKVMGEQTNNNRSSNDVTTSSEGKLNVSSDAGIYEFLIEGDESTGYYTIYDAINNGYLYAASGSSNHLKVQTTNNDNGKWTIDIDENGVATIKAQGTNSRNWMRNNSNIFSCYGSGQDDIYLFERDDDSGSQTVSVSIAETCTDGSKYYATYSSPFGFVIPDGLTVEEIGINNDGKLNVQAYTAGARVPANTGVMISSTAAGPKTLTLAGGGTSVLGSSNRLRSTGTNITAEKMAETDENCTFYRLTMHNGTDIGFWYGAEEGVAFDYSTANRAYLAVPSGAQAPARFWFTDEENGATNIEAVEAAEEGVKFIQNGKLYIKKNGVVYDMLGIVVR